MKAFDLKEKTVLEHINEIEDNELRDKCLNNLDTRYSNSKCFAPGMALMLGVFQDAKDKAYWDKAYEYLYRKFDSILKQYTTHDT